MKFNGLKRAMPRIDALNWVLNEILVLKREDEQYTKVYPSYFTYLF